MVNIFGLFKKKEVRQPQEEVSWEDIKDILAPYKRTVWFPKVEDQKSDEMASKFSGIPALAKGESWPCCSHCDEPMQLFLQLNSKDLPESAGKPFGDGFLQVFYCTNWDQECEIECEAYFPFSKSTLVRVVNYQPESVLSLDVSPVKDAFPEKSITGWEEQSDYPNWEELEELGLTLSDSQYEFWSEQEYPRNRDKLLGWPHWVQGVEYPDCPDCGNSMKFIFQIDSEDNIPYMFGDVGCAHITQCAEHKDKLAIAWACC